MWENQYLTSEKIAKQYNLPNKIFAQKNPSDSEKNLMARNEYESAKRNEQLLLRENQKILLTTRKAERELLQCASCQALTENADLAMVDAIANSPKLAAECKMRKSLNFKDVTKQDTNMSVLLKI